MRKLLYLCIEKGHLTLNKQKYSQVNGVAVGPTSGPALINIFMVVVEKNVMLSLSNYIPLRKRYVD